MNKETAIKAGGKLWEKGSMVRVYFNDKAQVAEVFNYAVVDSVSGMTPSGYDGMIKKGKTRSYYDVANSVFCTDEGDLANAARDNDVEVKRV